MRTTWMVSLSLAVLGLFSACHPKRETVPTTGTTRPGTTPRRASFTFKAAPNMALSARTIPGPPGAETRPVAAVQDEKGIRTEFVENEVLFSAKDEREVQVLLERYPGKIIRKLDLQLKHSPSRSVYVLQIDPSRARNVTLDNAWPAVAPRSRGGTFQVSSEAALNLLRVIARERGEGRTLRLNFLAKADSFEDGSTESPSAPWGPDAMQWSIFQRGGVFDYDIASAWRALECTKMDANKVHMAIIDVGFQQWGPEWDLPLPFKYSTKAFARNDDDEGKKPWHGIHVTQAAAGLADNRMGAAGPAGPVAQVSLIHNPRTEDGLIHAVSMARDMGARIINISWHSTVSAGLWGDDPDGLEDLTRDMWNKGFLLFASPGNDGENIDSVDDDGDEEYWYWPCENQGVICVGGLSGTAPVLHPSSNYSEGRGEFVDIWAPYEVLGGPDPDHRGNVARRMQGTSYSSPFAAGVAALIWAANPKLSNKQVWDLMSKHARGAPGLPRVNAYGPVREALKSVTDKRNVCPDEMIPNSDVTIHLSQGSVHILPCSVKFLDAGDCCSVTWTSSIEGTLGQGSSIYAVFDTHRPGPRVVTMTATDNKGHWESRQFTVTLVPPPPKAPTVEVAEPQSPIVLVGLGTAFVAKVNDDEHVEQDKCVWVSDRPGEGPWKGCRTAMQFTAAGTPTLTVTYTDAQGLSGSASMQLSVVEPTKGSNLKVNLVLEHLINEQWSKQDVASFGNARLRAYLIDTEGPGEADLSQYTFQWEVEHAGRKTVPDRFLGRSNQVLVVYDKVFVPGWVWSCGEQTFKVTVTVAHAKGEVSREAKAQLSYTLNLPACIK